MKKMRPGDYLGRYEIHSILGQGGSGIVYLAQDTHLGKKWAIKQIEKKNPKYEKQIVNEVFLMMELDHYGIPRVTDQMEDEDYYYIVMDYCKGDSLWEYCKKHTASVEDVIDWGIQLCDILEYLHSRKPAIIFRDIKPGNIICDEKKRLKLIDFGIARMENDMQDAKGTKGYAAPEQYRGISSVQSDIYNLGATLSWCMGRQKYRPLKAVLAKAMKDAPKKRFQSSEEMRGKLTGLKKKYRRKKKIRLAAACAAGLGISAVLTLGHSFYMESVSQKEVFLENAMGVEVHLQEELRKEKIRYQMQLEEKRALLEKQLQTLEEWNGSNHWRE